MIRGKQSYQSERINVDPDTEAAIDKYLSTRNLANRGFEDGNKRKQLVGLLGEVHVIEKLTGTPVVLEERQDGFDGGFDFTYKGHHIDVKTMERNSFVQGDYVNNFYTMQVAYDADIIVFCSYNSRENILEICGWIPKKDLSRVGIFYKKGTVRKRDDGTSFTFRQDNYEVRNKDLLPMSALLAL